MVKLQLVHSLLLVRLLIVQVERRRQEQRQQVQALRPKYLLYELDHRFLCLERERDQRHSQQLICGR